MQIKPIFLFLFSFAAVFVYPSKKQLIDKEVIKSTLKENLKGGLDFQNTAKSIFAYANQTAKKNYKKTLSTLFDGNYTYDELMDMFALLALNNDYSSLVLPFEELFFQHFSSRIDASKIFSDSRFIQTMYLIDGTIFPPLFCHRVLTEIADDEFKKNRAVVKQEDISVKKTGASVEIMFKDDKGIILEHPEDSTIEHCVVSNDEKLIATSSSKGEVYVWRADVGLLPKGTKKTLNLFDLKSYFCTGLAKISVLSFHNDGMSLLAEGKPSLMDEKNKYYQIGKFIFVSPVLFYVINTLKRHKDGVLAYPGGWFSNVYGSFNKQLSALGYPSNIIAKKIENRMGTFINFFISSQQDKQEISK